VGVLVIDYKNQVEDGDFAPNPDCYSSVKNLSATIRSLWVCAHATSPKLHV